MIKRVVGFLLLTLLTILIALGVFYHEIIFEAIKNFPKIYLLWYLIGTLNTTLVFLFIPKDKIVKKKKSQPAKEESK